MSDFSDDASDLVEPGGKVRLFVAPDLSEGSGFDLEEGQAHYLRHVMRAKPGDTVRLFNGRDGEWLASLAHVGKRGVTASCQRRTRPQDHAPDVWLCFAPIKKAPADYVAQKATELGAAVLQPVLTRRTIVSRVNVDRMRANAIEAAEQSDRLDVPDCREPQALSKLLAQWPADRRLLFCDEGGAPPVLQALAGQGKGPWAVIVGPEGGFDPEERAAIRALPQTVPASLGIRILRADTAALASLALWQAVLGD